MYVRDAQSQKGVVTVLRESARANGLEPHALGKPVVGVYQHSAGECTKVTLDDRLYELGQELAADELVEAVRHE